MMVPHNTEKHKTAYTVTVDYKHGEPVALEHLPRFPHVEIEPPSFFLPIAGTTTGISAHDRALTARQLATSSLGAKAADFTRPGHLNPLRYTEGGVLVRKGHTEAGVGEFCPARSEVMGAERRCQKKETGADQKDSKLLGLSFGATEMTEKGGKAAMAKNS